MAELVPSDRELQALKVLWRQGQATVREICNAINEEGDGLAYTTVLSLLQVMEHKGMVGHRQEGKAYAYFPKVERNRTFRKLAAGFLQKVFDGAVEEYLTHALRSRSTSAEELERLQRAIADEQGQLRKRRKKGGRK